MAEAGAARGRTWLQPVQYRSGKPGRPRAVHLRLVRYEVAGSTRRVLEVAAQALCGTGELVPAKKPATCRKCIRISGTEIEETHD